MADLITRQAAIDVLDRNHILGQGLLNDTLDHIADAIMTLPSTRGLVAAGALWNRVYIANYSNLMGIKSVKIWWQGNVGKSDFERLDDVLAWMPLPEPYREEGD